MAPLQPTPNRTASKRGFNFEEMASLGPKQLGSVDMDNLSCENEAFASPYQLKSPLNGNNDLKSSVVKNEKMIIIQDNAEISSPLKGNSNFLMPESKATNNTQNSILKNSPTRKRMSLIHESQYTDRESSAINKVVRVASRSKSPPERPRSSIAHLKVSDNKIFFGGSFPDSQNKNRGSARSIMDSKQFKKSTREIFVDEDCVKEFKNYQEEKDQELKQNKQDKMLIQMLAEEQKVSEIRKEEERREKSRKSSRKSSFRNDHPSKDSKSQKEELGLPPRGDYPQHNRSSERPESVGPNRSHTKPALAMNSSGPLHPHRPVYTSQAPGGPPSSGNLTIPLPQSPTPASSVLHSHKLLQGSLPQNQPSSQPSQPIQIQVPANLQFSSQTASIEVQNSDELKFLFRSDRFGNDLLLADGSHQKDNFGLIVWSKLFHMVKVFDLYSEKIKEAMKTRGGSEKKFGYSEAGKMVQNALAQANSLQASFSQEIKANRRVNVDELFKNLAAALELNTKLLLENQELQNKLKDSATEKQNMGNKVSNLEKMIDITIKNIETKKRKNSKDSSVRRMGSDYGLNSNRPKAWTSTRDEPSLKSNLGEESYFFTNEHSTKPLYSLNRKAAPNSFVGIQDFDKYKSSDNVANFGNKYKRPCPPRRQLGRKGYSLNDNNISVSTDHVGGGMQQSKFTNSRPFYTEGKANHHSDRFYPGNLKTELSYDNYSSGGQFYGGRNMCRIGLTKPKNINPAGEGVRLKRLIGGITNQTEHSSFNSSMRDNSNVKRHFTGPSNPELLNNYVDLTKYSSTKKGIEDTLFDSPEQLNTTSYRLHKMITNSHSRR